MAIKHSVETLHENITNDDTEVIDSLNAEAVIAGHTSTLPEVEGSRDGQRLADLKKVSSGAALAKEEVYLI